MTPNDLRHKIVDLSVEIQSRLEDLEIEAENHAASVRSTEKCLSRLCRELVNNIDKLEDWAQGLTQEETT